MNRSKSSPTAEGAVFAAHGVINSTRLLYFFHVASAGSFTVAETILNVAQSAISRQVQQLEEDLGTQLLGRHGRGVVLTPSGEILFKQAQAILDDMASTVERLREAKQKPSGQVSIASFASIMSVLMPDILHAYLARFPDVNVVAKQGSTGEVYEQLARGEVDVAILSQPVVNKKVVQHKLLVEPMYVVVSASHPLAKRPHMQREDLHDLDFVLPASAHGLRRVIEQYVGVNVSLSAPLRFDSTPLIKAFVRSGKYATIMPRLTFDPAEDPSPKDFALIPFKPKFTRTLVVASLEDRSRTPLVAALIKEVIAVFQRYTKEHAR